MGDRLGAFGPQQPGKRFARMLAMGFHGKIGEEGAHLVVGKPDRLPIQGGQEGSQQRER
jgi:hypothetical protein